LQIETTVERICHKGGTGGSSFVPDTEERSVLDFLLPTPWKSIGACVILANWLVRVP